MSKKKLVTTNELASMIKKGFDGVTKEMRAGFADVHSSHASIAETIAEVSEGIADLTELTKKGFDGTPTKQEVRTLQRAIRLMEKRDRAFAAKLGLTLAQIDSEG